MFEFLFDTSRNSDLQPLRILTSAASLHTANGLPHVIQEVKLQQKSGYDRNCRRYKSRILAVILLIIFFSNFVHQINMVSSDLERMTIPVTSDANSVVVVDCPPRSDNGKCGPKYGHTVCTSQTNRYCSKYGRCGSGYQFWKDTRNKKYWRESIPDGCYGKGTYICIDA